MPLSDRGTFAGLPAGIFVAHFVAIHRLAAIKRLIRHAESAIFSLFQNSAAMTDRPTFTLERDLLNQGHTCIIGVDEVGRGPWAGPVIAAAVHLNPDAIPGGLNDSKKLSPARRDALYRQLFETAAIGIGAATVEEIDTLNILRASLTAMARAVDNLAAAAKPSYALIDGNRLPKLPCPAQAVIKGDAKSVSIAAASIIAKVHRDRLMAELDAAHPGYGWAKNMGYGTKEHQAGLAALGVTPHHRRSFKPIRALLPDPAPVHKTAS